MIETVPYRVTVPGYGYVSYDGIPERNCFRLKVVLTEVICPWRESATYSLNQFQTGQKWNDDEEVLVSDEDCLDLHPAVRYAVRQLGVTVKSPQLTYECPSYYELIIHATRCGIGYIRTDRPFLYRRAKDISGWIREGLRRGL